MASMPIRVSRHVSRPGVQAVVVRFKKGEKRPAPHVRTVHTPTPPPVTDPQQDALRARVSAALQHQYEILDEIGRGGMSVVYRARDLRLGRDVAIKVLPPELAHDPAVGSRFTREAQTSAQLSHAHIVPIFDVGERDGIAYFVMALITGGSVAKRLDHQPLRAVDEV